MAKWKLYLERFGRKMFCFCWLLLGILHPEKWERVTRLLTFQDQATGEMFQVQCFNDGWIFWCDLGAGFKYVLFSSRKRVGRWPHLTSIFFFRWMVQPLTSDFMTEIYGFLSYARSHRHSWKVGDMYPLVNSSWVTGNSPIFIKSPERVDVPVSKAFAGVNRHVALRFSSNQRGGPANQSGKSKVTSWCLSFTVFFGGRLEISSDMAIRYSSLIRNICIYVYTYIHMRPYTNQYSMVEC